MKRLAVLLWVCIFATPLAAQQRSREQTIDLVSKTLADIRVRGAAEVRAGWTEAGIEAIVRVALNLRDELASNPYVRVSGISVGLPGGVSVELSFPEVSTPKP